MRSPEQFTRLGTLGIEEELITVDAAGRPAAGVDDLVHTDRPPAALADRLDHEMYDCIVETNTETCGDVDGLRAAISSTRDALVQYAARSGYGIAGTGLHPMAGPGAVSTSAKPRYEKMLDRLQYPQWRNTTAGLHVHVGVDDADKAVWIANQLRWYMPVVLALSANSPFYDSVDTGLASMRANVFGALPHTGTPPTFDSYEAFEGFRETLVETDSITDPGQLWWDVRPHDEHGTVEIRAPDAQHDTETIVALAEYVRALVLDLAARYEDGESIDGVHRDIVEQNKWRALRYGHDASFVDRDGESVVSLREVVDRECDRLDVTGLRGVIDRGSGAAMQRRRYRTGGLDAVCSAVTLGNPRIADSRDPRRQRSAR
jgi:carboxylate-amine ligase